MPADVIFRYILEPSEPNSPMPLGSTEKGFEFTIRGRNVRELVFSENVSVGHFVYKLSPVIDEEKEGVIYDKRNYRIELLIYNTGETNIIVLSEGSKVEKITFENGFRQAVKPPPEGPTKPPTPERPPTIGKSPITGDNTYFVLEIVGIAAALSIFIIVAVARRKNSKKEKDLSDL
jgi:hypothetical protein